jgi:hypothetical protein
MISARNVISPEEAANLRRLYAEYAVATAEANAALQSGGMNSEGFVEADMNVGRIWRRIRKILGAADHWMA